jgi:hypothetical protein
LEHVINLYTLSDAKAWVHIPILRKKKLAQDKPLQVIYDQRPMHHIYTPNYAAVMCMHMHLLNNKFNDQCKRVAQKYEQAI